MSAATEWVRDVLAQRGERLLDASETVRAYPWSTVTRFATDAGDFVATSNGDCCARCYVQHVSGSDALAPGATVRSVEDIEAPPVPKDADSYVVSDTWGHRITTDKGVCTIEMRVDHNGYYGGSLDLTEYEGVLAGKPLDDF